MENVVMLKYSVHFVYPENLNSLGFEDRHPAMKSLQSILKVYQLISFDDHYIVFWY